MAARRSLALRAIALGVLTSGALLGALMQHSEVTIPIPAAGERVPLEKLEYRARFVASINAVTLELATSEKADPVAVEWTFLGSNTDGQAHRVELAVRLLDESGSQIGVYRTKAILPAGASGRQIRLSMKVKPDVWSAAKKARIFADWMS